MNSLIGYHYFVPLSESSEPPPQLLEDSIRCAIKTYGASLLVSTPSYIRYIKKQFSSHEGRLITIVAGQANVEKDSLIMKYMRLIQQGVITSNHPQTEIRCLLRWVELKRHFNLLTDYDKIICLDWDTLCLNNHADQIGTLTKSYDIVYGQPLHSSIKPIYSVCPNHLLIGSESVLDLYLKYSHLILDKYMKIHSSTTITSNFTDMLGWSSVISRYTLSNPASLTDWNSLLSNTDYVFEHNIRVDQEEGLQFAMEEYSLNGCYCNYTGGDQLKLKKISRERASVYLSVENSIERIPKRKMPISLHLSGTEAKWLYYKYIRSIILGYE